MSQKHHPDRLAARSSRAGAYKKFKIGEFVHCSPRRYDMDKNIKTGTVVYEEGGAYGSTGWARIICGPNGEKKEAVRSENC